MSNLESKNRIARNVRPQDVSFDEVGFPIWNKMVQEGTSATLAAKPSSTVSAIVDKQVPEWGEWMDTVTHHVADKYHKVDMSYDQMRALLSSLMELTLLSIREYYIIHQSSSDTAADIAADAVPLNRTIINRCLSEANDLTELSIEMTKRTPDYEMLQQSVIVTLMDRVRETAIDVPGGGKAVAMDPIELLAQAISLTAYVYEQTISTGRMKRMFQSPPPEKGEDT